MAKNEDLHFKLGEMHSDIKSILVEAKRTNGRVTKLENDVDTINIRMAKYVGVVSAIIFVIQMFGQSIINSI